MLVKNEKKFCDAHFHYSDCLEKSLLQDDFTDWTGCSSAHSTAEWYIQSEAKLNNPDLMLSFGLHPQSAGFIDIDENLDFLNQLITEKKLNAVGEVGFDFFNEEFKLHRNLQEKMFLEQINLAIKNNLPVIIHCRKANEKLFEFSSKLNKLPAVLFHSFMGNSIEAESLLNKGINGYFSFGKQMMNNNRKVIDCIRTLPLNRLLCETDAPYQFLKNESGTKTEDIYLIYKAFFSYRNEETEIIYHQLRENFNNLFLL